jgi:hypothetical protein
MNQALKQNTLHQQLLQHMIEQQDLDIYDLMLANEQVNKPIISSFDQKKHRMGLKCITIAIWSRE